MSLLILAVDGLCPDIAKQKGYPRMPYEQKLTIPRELYFKGSPHTLKIWPSIFHGQVINVDLPRVLDQLYERDTIDYKLKQLLIKIGIKKILQKLKINYHKHVPKNVGQQWRAYPSSFGLETILDYHDSLSWNIPGLNPECIIGYPDLDVITPYVKREYENWKHITLGMCLQPRELNIAYTHILDALAHRFQPLDPFYLDISNHIKKLCRLSEIDIMLISDHGATPTGDHTDYAYLGTTFPIKAQNIIDVRHDIERFLKNSPPIAQSMTKDDSMSLNTNIRDREGS